MFVVDIQAKIQPPPTGFQIFQIFLFFKHLSGTIIHFEVATPAPGLSRHCATKLMRAQWMILYWILYLLFQDLFLLKKNFISTKLV